MRADELVRAVVFELSVVRAIEQSGGHIAIFIMNWIHRLHRWRGYFLILIEGVGRVGGRDSVGGRGEPIPGLIIGVSTIGGGGGLVFTRDLPKGVIGPSCGVDILGLSAIEFGADETVKIALFSLSDFVDGVTDDGEFPGSGNRAGVFLFAQDVAVCFVGVVHLVNRAGDFVDETGTGLVGVFKRVGLARQIRQALGAYTGKSSAHVIAISDRVLATDRKSGGTLQIVAVAVKDTRQDGERARAIRVYGDGFGVEGEGAGIVVVVRRRKAIRLADLATEAVIGERNRGGICGIVRVSRGSELSGGGVQL